MYQKILVPLDGSKLAECALPHVISMGKGGVVGEVTLLNVVNVYISGHSEYPGPININQIRENLFMESSKYLADVESRLASEGIKVKRVSLEGNRPADIISEYAQKNAIDMIVIASHGRSGMKKMMFGSVALRVLHDSHVPMLLIRPEVCRKESIP